MWVIVIDLWNNSTPRRRRLRVIKTDGEFSDPPAFSLFMRQLEVQTFLRVDYQNSLLIWMTQPEWKVNWQQGASLLDYGIHTYSESLLTIRMRNNAYRYTGTIISFVYCLLSPVSCLLSSAWHLSIEMSTSRMEYFQNGQHPPLPFICI